MVMEKVLIKMLGLTLLETLLALAVGALVLVGGLMFYISATRNSSVNQAVSDMNAIVTAYKSYALGNTITADTTITVLQNNKLLPNPFINPWGAVYDTIVNVATGTTPTTVLIHFRNIRGIGQGNGQDCAAILQAAQPTAKRVDQPSGGNAGCYFQYTL